MSGEKFIAWLPPVLGVCLLIGSRGQTPVARPSWDEAAVRAAAPVDRIRPGYAALRFAAVDDAPAVRIEKTVLPPENAVNLGIPKRRLLPGTSDGQPGPVLLTPRSDRRANDAEKGWGWLDQDLRDRRAKTTPTPTRTTDPAPWLPSSLGDEPDAAFRLSPERPAQPGVRSILGDTDDRTLRKPSPWEMPMTTPNTGRANENDKAPNRGWKTPATALDWNHSKETGEAPTPGYGSLFPPPTSKKR